MAKAPVTTDSDDGIARDPGASGDYRLTSVSHAAADSPPPAGSDFLFAAAGAESGRSFNGLVSRFSAGGRDVYEGAHLFQDVVIPAAQLDDGTSNTVVFVEAVIRPSLHDSDFAM